MNKESIGRAILRLYPPETRRQIGNEMLGTLLDAGDASASAYLRQLVSLIASALLARALTELRRPLRQIALTALCWVALMSVMDQLVTVIGIRLAWGGTPGSDPETILYCYVLPVLMLTLFTLGRNRLTGILGFVWLGICLNQHSQLSVIDFLQLIPAQAAGFGILVATPRRPLAAGRILWLFPAAAWLLYQVTLIGQQSGVGKTVPALVALLLLPWAPSLAVGTAVAWGLTSIFYVNEYLMTPGFPHLLVLGVELGACVPISIVVAAIARRAAAARRLHRE